MNTRRSTSLLFTHSFICLPTFSTVVDDDDSWVELKIFGLKFLCFLCLLNVVFLFYFRAQTQNTSSAYVKNFQLHPSRGEERKPNPHQCTRPELINFVSESYNNFFLKYIFVRIFPNALFCFCFCCRRGDEEGEEIFQSLSFLALFRGS